MKNVAAAIIKKESKILLAKRNKNGDLPGFWEFPGGKKENNETIFECIEREIFEELNIKCKALKIYSENIFEYENGIIKLIAILVELLEDKIVLNVHDEYKWIETNELLNHKLAPADIAIAQKIIKESNYV